MMRLLFLLGLSLTSLVTVHAACGPTGGTLGPSCTANGRTVVSSSLTDAEKQSILAKHNELRNKVANGEEVDNYSNIQAASNMRELEWDNALAVTAQEWANSCVFGHDDSSCRKTGTSYSGVGQNAAMAAGGSSAYTDNPRKTVAQMADGWYSSEINLYQGSVDSLSWDLNQDAGHFTQVVWAETQKIGCGKVLFTYYNAPWYWAKQHLVCNYGEGGNVEGEALYNVGAACSACPTGTSCSTTYNGLCKAN